MAIYKLSELYSSKPEYGAGLAAQSIGNFKYVRQTDISNSVFPTFVDEGPILKNNDVLISRAGANSGETYIHKSGENHVFAGFLVRYNFDQEKLLNEYFYYWTKSESYGNQVKRVSNSGSTMPKLNPPVVGSIKIDLPSVKEQQRIIDIIEPLDKMLYTINKSLTLQKNIFNLKKTNNTISNYVDNINSGYSYTKSDKNEEGKYGIYTIKNISGSIKYDKTDLVKNNSLHIGDVITGMSGTIGTSTIIDSNNLVSNQRTLSFKSDFSAQISFAIESQKRKLDNIATGAVQKNIKKDDILNLNFEPIFDKSFDETYIKLLILRKNITDSKNHILNLLIK